MKKWMATVAAGTLITVSLPLLTVGAVAALLSEPIPGVAQGNAASPARIPSVLLDLYVRAAATCPGLSWTVLAAVGTVESGNGLSALPGVHGGRNRAGAEGPMQFEPATFARYDRPVPPGGARPPSPYDPTDAVYAAARMLCADGGARPAGLAAALFDYNHSTQYVHHVELVAASLASTSGTGPAADAVRAAAWALAQVGTPYRWGGEIPGVGFDCSGLVQAAWAAAGVALPRVAAAQFAAGPLLPPGTALRPGDLVFFGSVADGVSHVGMVVAPGQMVDAPHTGSVVRVEAFPSRIGEAWGGDHLVGVTRPGGD